MIRSSPMPAAASLPNNPISPLPLPDQHWIPSRKAAVVGEISLEEACRRYRFCPDEFNNWVAAIDKHGIPGLRATRVQIYR